MTVIIAGAIVLAAVLAAVFLVPVGAATSCYEAPTASTADRACETTWQPLAGIALGYGY
ncbi:hypothetical protein [Demequina sp.]|uniref:hypothetical protein n=1 Tax=Demequina sp. TaxID=2050685 RepID=UPI003A8B4CC7